MTPLAEKLAAAHPRATARSPSPSSWTPASSDPEHGYYMRREPFGRAGDFITAPEISQMFGELVGLWAVATWEMMGEPPRFVLAEFGPGRGTLMADILRTANVKPGFRDAADVHLVEISPRLAEIQRATLSARGLAIHWHRRLQDVPAGPAIFIANEFFDAMPIRQFQWTDGRWTERVVGLDPDGSLAIGLRPVTQRPPGVELPDGAIVEAATGGQAVVTAIAERLVDAGGAALIIDYGSGKPGYGDTLQAVRQHKYDDPLATPGETLPSLSIRRINCSTLMKFIVSRRVLRMVSIMRRSRLIDFVQLPPPCIILRTVPDNPDDHRDRKRDLIGIVCSSRRFEAVHMPLERCPYRSRFATVQLTKKFRRSCP